MRSQTHSKHTKHTHNTLQHYGTHLKYPLYFPTPRVCIKNNVRIKRDTYLNLTPWLLLLFRLYFSFLHRSPPLFILLLPPIASIYISEPRNTSKCYILDKIFRKWRVWLCCCSSSSSLSPFFLLNLLYFSFLPLPATIIYTPEPKNTRKHVEITRY